MSARLLPRSLSYILVAIALVLSVLTLVSRSPTTVQAARPLSTDSFTAKRHAPAVVAGTTYVVNSLLDEPDADPSNGVCFSTPSGKCTLRAAIMDANFATGPNTITLPSGMYVLTRPGYDDNALVGDLDIGHDLTIQGAGSGGTIVDGNGAVTGDRVFQILNTAQNVTLSGMTIRNGQSLSSTIGVIGGGGLYLEGGGHLHLGDVIIKGNTAQNGGGLYANFSSQGGSIEMNNVIVRANTATSGGVGAGGGVLAHLPSNLSQVVIRDSQVYSNTADGTGGGLYVDGTTSAQWSIQRSEIYSNTAASGGGIGNFVPLALFDSRLHNNHVTFDGGAIEAFSPLVIVRTTLDANTAGRFGGGLFDLQTGGNALYPDFAHIEQSTLSGNSAQYGGGIYHDGFIYAPTLMTLMNSTLSGNAVSHDGGGLYAYSGQTQLFNATIASNRAERSFFQHYPVRGGGVFITSTAIITAQNSLIANNVSGTDLTPPSLDDCFGPLRSLGYNLLETTSNCSISGTTFGNITGQDPLLGLLQNNGGSTLTQVPLSGSPAIDHGDNTACPSSDQRGFRRPIGSQCDIGAVEVGPYVYLPLATK